MIRRSFAVAAAAVVTSLALIPGSTREALAGAPGGSHTAVGRVDAKSSDFYRIVFLRNEEGRVIVRGDGDTDLDCFLYDENGNEVDRDDDDTDTCALRVVPRWTGAFRIEVRNHGAVYNQYVIVTN